jgi:hypothetical protein
MVNAKASFLIGAFLLFAIVVASLAALGVGWFVSLAGLSEAWVGLLTCLTWAGVLVAIFTADNGWWKARKKNRPLSVSKKVLR